MLGKVEVGEGWKLGKVEGGEVGSWGRWKLGKVEVGESGS